MATSPEIDSGKDNSGLKSIQDKNFKGFGELNEQDKGIFITLSTKWKYILFSK